MERLPFLLILLSVFATAGGQINDDEVELYSIEGHGILHSGGLSLNMTQLASMVAADDALKQQRIRQNGTTTCADLLAANASLSDGRYSIIVANETMEVFCAMSLGGYTAIAYVIDNPQNRPPVIGDFYSWEEYRRHSWRGKDGVSYYVSLVAFELLLGSGSTVIKRNVNRNGQFNASLHLESRFRDVRYNSQLMPLSACPGARQETHSAGGCLTFDYNTAQIANGHMLWPWTTTAPNFAGPGTACYYIQNQSRRYAIRAYATDVSCRSNDAIFRFNSTQPAVLMSANRAAEGVMWLVKLE